MPVAVVVVLVAVALAVVVLDPLLVADESDDVEDWVDAEDVDDEADVGEVVVEIDDVVVGVAVVVLLIEKPGDTLMLGVSRV